MTAVASTAPTMADLTAAYNTFVAALKSLSDALLQALLDPDTWGAAAELADAIWNIVWAGVGMGACILEAIP